MVKMPMRYLWPLLLFLFLFVGSGTLHAQSKPKPNIVLILMTHYFAETTKIVTEV